MQNSTAKISFYFSSALAGVAVVLRFVQLLFFSDKNTGLVNDGGEIYSYFVYVLLIFSLILCFLSARKSNVNCTAVDEKSKSPPIKITAFLLSLMFFADFISQFYICITYITDNSFIEWNYFVPMVLVGVSAILSCFYFFVVGLTYTGLNYDFSGFGIFHFIVPFWAFSRLFGILLQMVSVSSATQTVCEFIYLVFAIMFFLSFITAVDSKNNAGHTIVFFAYGMFLSSLVFALPGIITLFTEKASLFSVNQLCDVVGGVFALVFVKDIKKRSQ